MADQPGGVSPGLNWSKLIISALVIVVAITVMTGRISSGFMRDAVSSAFMQDLHDHFNLWLGTAKK